MGADCTPATAHEVKSPLFSGRQHSPVPMPLRDAVKLDASMIAIRVPWTRPAPALEPIGEMDLDILTYPLGRSDVEVRLGPGQVHEDHGHRIIDHWMAGTHLPGRARAPP